MAQNNKRAQIKRAGEQAKAKSAAAGHGRTKQFRLAKEARENAASSSESELE